MPAAFHCGNYNDGDWASYDAPHQYGYVGFCAKRGVKGTSGYRALYIVVGESDYHIKFRRLWDASDSGWITVSNQT